ncbi:MAG TPA: hybrid sensor histidine kinase/response regulator [Vicinamibacterales bacterium]|nr:hybrid sensor histidine kinase/response regulator [Vicinamibacterales bacterium]
MILLGAYWVVLFFPLTLPSPTLFAALLLFSCLTSTWKVTLPISVANGSTLSVSYAANVMALLLLGPRQAVLIAVAGVLVQCTYKRKQPYPLHRTLFSVAAMVITMTATGLIYFWLGGPIPPQGSDGLAKPLVGAIATYFLVNTGLVAGAVALTNKRTVVETWRQEFMWLAASFMAAGTAGALAAVVVVRGEHWKALLLTAPIYLTYKTYGLFVGRLEDHKRHMLEMSRLHEQTVTALGQARDAERALASEKERLTTALEEKTRLEEARKQLLAREYAARASAEAANRLKDQFLATVSHELRTPLTAMLGWADMLRRGVMDDARRDRAVWAIHASAKRQAQLIDDLLDVSRIMSGKLRLHRTPVSLEGVVHDAVQVIQQAADANGIRITIDADPLVGLVHADPARLQQIACNLLSNAVKFTPPGGVVSVRLRRTPRNTAEMMVTDTGEGISPHFLPAVFDPFRQADASTTRVHRGLGIGLSIVKNLVEAHGGTVSAHSAGEGRGATFIVELPVATVNAAATRTAPGLAAEPADPPPPLDGLSVLVVDDDVESREVVAEYLRASRARVLSAASAAQALEVLKREQVDVLLADIGMPEEDGYSLIRKVRALEMETSLIPAAALTAFARESDREEALRAGFQLHLPKPIDARSLVEAVAILGATGTPGADAAPRA